MNPALHLLAPLALLFPVAAVVEAPRGAIEPVNPQVTPLPARQVSIEQRVTIRINPRPAPLPVMPDLLERSANREPRFVERKMGKCVPLTGIVGIQPVTTDKLLLIMRNDRLITARIEKGCQAREFYSGLIVKRAADGQLCVARDKLMSRSGANCQVVGFRQIVQVGE